MTTSNAVINAVASSSKRAASPCTHPAKRSRPCTSSTGSTSTKVEQDDEDEDEGPAPANMTAEELKARLARKEARTIRNRESAQRSRNQRKAHLANLESRVLELEAENRALRNGASPRSSPPTPGYDRELIVNRETSPAQSVMSLANDLGIPTELVSGNGVNLANVAPPPADIMSMEDVKPVIAKSPSPSYLPKEEKVETPLEALNRENVALRERVSLLENLVKQVVAVANLSGLENPSSTRQASETPDCDVLSATAQSQPTIDWSTFIASSEHLPTAPGLETTLASPYFANNTPSFGPYVQTSVNNLAYTYSSSTLSENENESKSNPVARHPAAGEGDLGFYEFGINGVIDESRGFGQGSSTLGNGGQIGGGAGSAAGLAGESVAFADNMSQEQQAIAIGGGQVWTEDGQQEVENWDEAMRLLLEDLEGGAQGMGGGVRGVGTGDGSVGLELETGQVDRGMGIGLGLDWSGMGLAV